MDRIDSFTLRFGASSGLLASEPVRWAAGQLADALKASGAVQVESGGSTIIDVLQADSDAAKLHLTEAGLAIPDAAESFVLLRADDHIIAIGADVRGLVYALTELADRVRARRRSLSAEASRSRNCRRRDPLDVPRLRERDRGQALAVRQGAMARVSRHAGRRTGSTGSRCRSAWDTTTPTTTTSSATSICTSPIPTCSPCPATRSASRNCRTASARPISRC